ncbi:MAG: twin-arginine translocase TatA/TatE family subunit [Acidimicrobiales bacterium]
MPQGLTSPSHLLVILVVALIVMGPDKLPGALRQAGRAMAEVQRWSESVRGELHEVLVDASTSEPTGTDVGEQAPPGASVDTVAPGDADQIGPAPQLETLTHPPPKDSP